MSKEVLAHGMQSVDWFKEYHWVSKPLCLGLVS